MEIYVPLAERIGMQALKDELEDLSFQHLHPEAYESITSRLSFLAEKGEKETFKYIRKWTWEGPFFISVIYGKTVTVHTALTL